MNRRPGNKAAHGARIFSSGMKLRNVVPIALLATIAGAAAGPCHSQMTADLQSFLQEDIGLSREQIAAIGRGDVVAKALPSRTPSELFLFGVVYVHAAPEAYVQFARDFNRIRKLPNYLALGVVSDPPQLSDFKGFAFDSDDVEALKNCQPGNCLIQLPASSIEEFQQAVNWSAPDADEQVGRLLEKGALQGLLAYQRKGNAVLGVYRDKRNPTDVPKQFAYMLSYYKAFPERLPDFYQYLLTYPNGKPANVEDAFYWAKVKFGLKPTLRIVQMATMRGSPADAVAYAVAQKQLYSSHYFETALDLAFCVRGNEDAKQPGFYLLMTMGSEQAGLTGVKGGIVRKVAMDRSVSSLRNGLTTIRNALESAR